MFDADRPILSHEQDCLGRTVFAKYLARCLLDHQLPESVAIGLYGASGSGKTSVINLTLEEIRLAASSLLEEEKPIILNFSPWSYSGQNQLIYSFFRRLSSELRRAPHLENADRIIYLLELYVSYFTHLAPPEPYRPKQNFLTRLFSSQHKMHGWESGRDLTQIKAELNLLLAQQKHKIIIFIDNISRIENAEIKQIFQIVKSMGDYSNTIYLLAMDKTQVTDALGTEYLEKIVQFPFDIPVISKQDLEALLFTKLKKIMAEVPEESWNVEYWSDIYYSSMKHFFENCRDLTHYVNTLSFSFLRVKEIVNPVDFFAITAVQVFAPEVYHGIRDNKDLFSDLADDVYEFDQQKLAEDKIRCDEILDRPSQVVHEDLLTLLLYLFPRLRKMYQTTLSLTHSESDARKKKRICSPDVFDIYFRLSIQSNSISESEMNAILNLTKDEEGFALALLRLNHDNRINAFLDALDSRAAHRIPTAHIDNVICALLDSGDLFPEGDSTQLSCNVPLRIHRIIQQLLDRLKSNDERNAILSHAILHATNSIYIITHELRLHKQDQRYSLQKLAVDKIINWGKIGRLVEHPKLLPLLYAWKEWGNTEDCRQFVGSMVQDDKGLIAFLSAVLKDPIQQTMTELKKNAAWENELSLIEEFVPIQILEPHARMLFEDASFEKLREQEQLAVLIFLDLIKSETNKLIPKTSV